MGRVAVNRQVLGWALDRSGRTLEYVEQRLPNVRQWVAGQSQPTLRQLELLAKRTGTPLGFFFLDEPPDEQLPLPYFRTLADEGLRGPTADLLETIYTMQRRQAWMHEYLLEQGQERLPFVGSVESGEGPASIARRVRCTLRLDEDWAARQPTWTGALRFLTRTMENAGILVVVSGIVGNNTHRKLDPGEFRGFVLADQYAPLVFVNGADSKAAQMFTLGHELAHVFLGSSAAFDLREMQPAKDPNEQACNRAAAEFLVPEGRLRETWPSVQRDPLCFQEVARRFKVSELVAARRALDLGLVRKEAFLEFYREYQNAQRQRAVRQREGGDFYATQNLRLGQRFARAVVRAAKEGKLLYSEAYRLTGLYGKAFVQYAASLEIRGA